MKNILIIMMVLMTGCATNGIHKYECSPILYKVSLNVAAKSQKEAERVGNKVLKKVKVPARVSCQQLY